MFVAINTILPDSDKRKAKTLFFLSQCATVSHSVGSSSMAVPETHNRFCSSGCTRDPLYIAFQSWPGWIICVTSNTHEGLAKIKYFFFPVSCSDLYFSLQSCAVWLNPIMQDMLRHIFQSCILESNQEILELIQKALLSLFHNLNVLSDWYVNLFINMLMFSRCGGSCCDRLHSSMWWRPAVLGWVPGSVWWCKRHTSQSTPTCCWK